MLQKPDLTGLAEFLKPLNEVVMKANALTEGRRSDFFNHLKTAADSLAALFWIAYTGKDCGKWKCCSDIYISSHHLLFFFLPLCISYAILFFSSRYEPSNCACGRKLANGRVL